MGANLRFDQSGGAGAGSPGLSRRDLWLNQVVDLVSIGTGVTFEWQLLDKPPASTATITDPTLPTAQITLDVRNHTYRIRLIVDNGLVPANIITRLICATKDSVGVVVGNGWRIPAFFESPEEAVGLNTPNRGAATDLDDIFDDLLGLYDGTADLTVNNLTVEGDLTLPNLSPGYLKVDGANVAYTSATVSIPDLQIDGEAHGDVIFFNGTEWTNLLAGTSGQYLKTLGPGSDPVWDTPGGGGSSTYISDTFACPSGVTVGDAVYIYAADAVDRANASSTTTSPAIGIVRAKPTPLTAEVVFQGVVSGLTGLTFGEEYFLGLVDGTIVPLSSAPSGSGQTLQRIGTAISATKLLVHLGGEHTVLLQWPGW